MFAQTLKESLTASDVSISKLSRESGISRALLHKVINGEIDLNQDKFDQLIKATSLSDTIKQRLIREYLSNNEYAHIFQVNRRVQNLIAMIKEQPRGTQGEAKLQPCANSYEMVEDEELIRVIIIELVTKYQNRIHILNEDESLLELYLPRSGRNIIQIKNISDANRKTEYLNPLLAAYLKNPDYQGYYTINPTVNLSGYDNYVLVDEILLMYDNELTSLCYTAQKNRIDFFERIFYERLEQASRYFIVKPHERDLRVDWEITQKIKIVSNETDYYFTAHDRIVSIDSQLQDELSDYFGKGEMYVKIHK